MHQARYPGLESSETIKWSHILSQSEAIAEFRNAHNDLESGLACQSHRHACVALVRCFSLECATLLSTVLIRKYAARWWHLMQQTWNHFKSWNRMNMLLQSSTFCSCTENRALADGIHLVQVVIVYSAQVRRVTWDCLKMKISWQRMIGHKVFNGETYIQPVYSFLWSS